MSVADRSLRPVVAADHARIRLLHREAFADLVARVHGPWDDARHQASDAVLASPEARAVVVDGVIAGWLRVEDWRIARWLDIIAIGPEHQGRGLGAAILADLIREEPPLALSVYRANRATALYRRLGFVPYASDPVRVWHVHGPPSLALLLASLAHRGTRHVVGLRDGGSLTGAIRTVGPEVLTMVLASSETVELPLADVDPGALQYLDRDGWVRLTPPA